VGLINLRRRNKWFSPFSPNLVQKSKDKEKWKSHANPNKEGYSKPFTDASDPKVEREEKGRNAHTTIKDSI
jgi:hypothetical protein